MSTHPRHTAHEVEAGRLVGEVEALLGAGARLALVAAHDDGPSGFRVVYLFADPAQGRTELVLRVPREAPAIPSLASLSFPAGRFERGLQDTFGITPTGHPRPRRLVLHDHWPVDWYPMRRDATTEPRFGPDRGTFSFVPVLGEGVYEIPVGPVHAGMIEPGHFRFSVVGETIIRMKARLWFVHRGMEKLFEGRTAAEGLALAEVISGDTAVGHGLAFAMAVEDAAGLVVDEQDRLVRALLLELERLHNHVSDLGAIANDVGFGIAAAHTQRLRERLLRQHAALTGHRLLRGGVRIGGAALAGDVDVALVRGVASELAEVVDITLGNSVVMDRFVGTAVLGREAAAEMGVLGYVARASGLDVDARRDHPFVDLGDRFAVVTRQDGDVHARFAVRAEEAQVSAALVADLADRLDGRRGTGRSAADLTGAASRSGASLVEAWRGTACHRVELDASGRTTRVAVVDPSFFTWPALPVSLQDTIVPDFPLANKSFNQSYAGNDL
ncbi:NADH-quinone oxidoreductase subunit C [Actinotalea sp. M2MS4P-6]|uniref:hydrogenase large subunit n=1 Tax=Actinotalea sp. M2MS4P-6 TaxID=2983762 RepID=UPI0021E3B764|nr:NADH-quinone oxidoreductase subunit C [Actinotalea sp. M2MS4P-6]MCV2395705.1 NADH-quinone oxidoreductase subunit C [Actinotalea sp. M2MS4P-6]